MTGTCWQVVSAPPPRREEARLLEDLEEGTEKGWGSPYNEEGFSLGRCSGFLSWEGVWGGPGSLWDPLAPKPGYIRRQVSSSR